MHAVGLTTMETSITRMSDIGDTSGLWSAQKWGKNLARVVQHRLLSSANNVVLYVCILHRLVDGFFFFLRDPGVVCRVRFQMKLKQLSTRSFCSSNMS